MAVPCFFRAVAAPVSIVMGFCLPVLVISAGARADHAAAGPGWAGCRAANPDERIAGCSNVIADLSKETPHGQVAAYVNRASAYQAKGNLDAALADLGKAIGIDPKSAAALAARAGVYQARGEFDKAIADYDQAAAGDAPANAQIFLGRALAYRAKGDKDKTLADLNAALKLDAKNLPALVARAALYHSAGDHEHAIADYTAIIRLDPKQVGALNGRGACYYARADYDRALADFDAALKVDANYVAALVNRAGAWRGKKDFQRARADYERALSIRPNLAVARKGADDMAKILAKKAQDVAAPSIAPPRVEHEHNCARAANRPTHGRCAPAQFFLGSRTAARTSAAWPGAETFRQTRAIRPFSSIRKVERSTPIYFLPYMLFSIQTP